MRRALAALVVTVVAVVLLARYQTQPPPEPPPPARAAKAPARPTPGVKVGTRPLRTLSLSGADAHTRSINARAEPLLRAEALRAESARIDTVSGATYTSESWIESLEAAIRDARRG